MIAKQGDSTISGAYKRLARSVLNVALQDARTQYRWNDALWFSTTEWCESLCAMAGFDYDDYKKRLREQLPATIKKEFDNGRDSKSIKVEKLAKILGRKQADTTEVGKGSEMRS